MKKINFTFIVFIFIIFIFTGCNNTPKNKGNNTGNIQGVSEVTNPQTSNNQIPTQPSVEVLPSPKEPAKQPEPERTLLGSYSTSLGNSDKNRISNIKLAVKKINGYKLKPNETFSFNDIVGVRSAKNGFKSAKIIVYDEYVKGLGGGVCQLSSTIFNAADQAGLEIVERHSHTVTVSYVPKGRDAAVVYKKLDLKFKNTKEYPIEIRVEIKDKKINAAVWKSK